MSKTCHCTKHVRHLQKELQTQWKQKLNKMLAKNTIVGAVKTVNNPLKLLNMCN